MFKMDKNVNKYFCSLKYSSISGVNDIWFSEMIIFNKQLQNENFYFSVKKLSINKSYTNSHINMVFNQNMF